MRNLFTNLTNLNVRYLCTAGLMLWVLLCLPYISYAQPGCTSITGTYTESGTLQIELEGTSACTQFDQVQVTGNSVISGATINIVLYNSYVPPATCTSWDIVTTTTGVSLGAVTVNYPIGYDGTIAVVGNNLRITLIPETSISYVTPLCTTGLPVSPTFLGATGGAYTATPVGLTINSATGEITSPSAGGSYTVSYEVPASGGCATVLATAPIVIDALNVTAYAPNASGLPGTRNECVGDNTTFRVTYNSTVPLASRTFLWEYNDGSGWADVSSLTGITFTNNNAYHQLNIANLPASYDDHTFRLTITAGACTFTSAPFTLNVNGTLTVNSTTPTSYPYCSGAFPSNSMFNSDVTNSGAGTISRLWQYSNDGGTTWNTVSGAGSAGGTTATLTLQPNWANLPTVGNSILLRMRAQVQPNNEPGCRVFSDLITITHNPNPIVDAGTYGPVCEDADDIILAGTPTGGVWTGTGVSGSYVFDPSVGTQTLSYTVTELGCASTAMTTITVNTLPTAGINGTLTICEVGRTTNLTGTAVGGSGTYDTHNWTSGTPANVSLSPTNTTMTTATGLMQGMSLITYTVTDNLGCSSSSQVTVNVVNPAAGPAVTSTNGDGSADIRNYTCGATVNLTNDIGACNAPRSIAKPTWMDLCGTVTTTGQSAMPTLTLTNLNATTILGTFPVGSTVVTFTATDDLGNMNSCSLTIAVSDTQLPSITCPTNINVNSNGGQDNVAGDCAATVNWTTLTASDNCPGVTVNPINALNIVVPDPVNTAFPVGVSTVIYRATDASGNTNTCSFTVTVVDNELPTASNPADIDVQCFSDIPAPDVTVVTDEMDNCTANLVVTWVSDNITSAGCDGDQVTVLRTYSISDGVSSITVTQTINVEDTTDPTASNPTDINVQCFSDIPAPDVTVVTDEMDNCDGTVVVAFVSDDITSATCDGATVTVTRTYSVTDCAGNSITVTQLINVEDTTDPTASNPTDIDVQCFSDIPAPDVTVVTDEMDNCDGTVVVAFVSDDITSATCDGATVTVTRTYSVTDCAGNSITVTQLINVEDTTDPTASNPTDIDVQCFSDIPAPDVTVVTDEMDNCDGTVVVAFVSDDITSATCDGATVTVTRTYSVTDCAGNSITVTQLINVEDTTDPTASNPTDIDVQCFSDIPAPDVTVVTDEMDNCDGTVVVAFVSDDITSATCDGATVTVTRTYSVTDCAGNSITVTQLINVEDTTDPTASNPTDIDVQCFSDIPAPDVTVVTDEMDNCDGTVVVAFVSDDITSATCDGATVTVTRTYSVTDCAGNSITVTQLINVEDTTDPTASNPTDIDVQCFSDIPAPDVTVVTDEMDNCDGTVVVAFVSDDITSATCDGATVTVTRTYSVTDCAGNSITVMQLINVEDTTDPTASNPTDIDVQCFSDIPAPDVTVVTDEMDNCDGTVVVAFVSDDITSATCDGATVTVTRTYSVTDCAGNSITVTQLINVEDTTDPTASNPTDIDVQCFSDIPAPDVTVVTDEMDNCDGTVVVAFVSDDITSATCDGATVTVTRTYSVTDCAGNSITVTQLINVEDTTDPTASNPTDIDVQCFSDIPAPDVTVVTDEMDNCDGTVVVAFVSDDITSATCDGATVTVTRTYSVTDCAGNSITVTQLINVEDTTDPTASNPTDIDVQCFSDIPAPDVTVVTDEMDNCDGTVVVAFVSDDITSAICDGATVTVTRTYSVTDCAGNSITVTQLINVEDTTDPTASNPTDIDVQCFSDIPAPDVTVVTDEMDNCDGTVVVAFVSDDITSATCDGATVTVTRTYSVTDCAGNSITVMQLINVEDTTDPTASNPTDIDVQCFSDIPAPDVTVVTDEMDNCDGTVVVAFVSDDITSATCDGATVTVTRTYSVTDCAGNSITVTQLINVEDTTDPTASNPTDIDVQCFSDIPAPDVTVVTDEMDNCDGTVVVAFVSDDITSATCDGATVTVTRTYSVTDCAGNSITVTQLINVEDTTDPTAQCPSSNVIVTLGSMGTYTLTQTEIDNLGAGSTDNCLGALTFAISDSFFNCDDSGFGVANDNIQSRVLTVTDCAGNSATCSVTFDIQPLDPLADNATAPEVVAVCSDEIYELNLQNYIDNGVDATFEWTVDYGATTGGNAIGTQTSAVVSEVLNNITNDPIGVVYNVTAFNEDSGCEGSTFTVTQFINPEPVGVSQMFTVCHGQDWNFDVSTYFSNNLTEGVEWSIAYNNDIFVENEYLDGGNIGTPFGNVNISGINVINNSTQIRTLTYTITPRSLVNKCVGTPFTVVIKVLPEVTVDLQSNGDFTLCVNESRTLTSSVVPNGTYTYAWTVDNANATLKTPTNTSSVELTGAAAGPVVVTLTVTDMVSGCTAATDAVTFTINANPIAGASAANPTICEGQSTTLMATGGGTYQWNDPLNSSSATITVSPSQTTGYLVTVTNAAGCTDVATVSVTVTPEPQAPAVTGNVVCTGSTSGILTAECELAPPVINTPATLGFAGPPLIVPVSGTGAPDCSSATSSVLVSAVSGTLGTNYNINNVTVNVSHTWNQDLDIDLIAPNGVIIRLAHDKGGSGDNYANTVFQTGGAVLPTSNTTIGVGPFAPQDAFAGLNGTTMTGNWTLRVCDDESLLSGTLNSWSISFAPILTPTPSCTVKWYNQLVGGTQVGEGTSYDPIAEGDISSATAGSHNFYAECNCDGCPSDRSLAVLTINAATPVTITAAGPFCQYADPINLTASVSGGTWSGQGITNANTGAFNPTIAGPGVHIITYTYINGNLCTSVVTTSITVTADVTPPSIANCPGNQSATVSSFACFALPTWIAPTATDDCKLVSFTNNVQPFYTPGVHTITYTATDAAGLVSTCSFTFTVSDMTAPNIFGCPSNQTLGNDPGVCSKSFTWNSPSTSDACGLLSWQVAYTAGTPVPSSLPTGGFLASPLSLPTTATFFPGETIITYTSTDGNGNTATCSFTVTINDTEAPMAICQDITVDLDVNGNAAISSGMIDNGSTDNCGIAGLSVSPSSFNCSNVGPNTVILTVTDVNGLSSTCTAIVTVNDVTPPVALCQNISVDLDVDGEATITAAQIDNGSSDACGIMSMNLDITEFDCTNVGANNTVVLTVTDNNGLSSTCTATVTVNDVTPPVAVCQNISVDLDVDGEATITAAQIDNGSSDACGIMSMTLDITEFDCTNVGPNNTVVLTVTDNNGLSSTCTATVTVNDVTPPTAVCQNISVNLDVDGEATITTAQIDNGSSDACGIMSLNLDITEFDCTNVGPNNTVVLTVTDNNGLSSTCTATVTVNDVTPPVAVCQNISVDLDVDGEAIITAAQIDNGSSDACGIMSLSLDITEFDCTNVGPNNTVILTVTDNNGLSSTCTATVTVNDVTPPTVICQNISVDLDATGNVSITSNQIDNGSSDACGIVSKTLDISTFTCANVGANSVVLTVTDNNGLSSTCSAIVTVNDVTAPIAICQDITVNLDASGNVSIDSSYVDNGSSDACGIAFISVSPSSFTCANVGPNTVIMTVTDVNGNSTTCTSIVMVNDVTPPVAVCQNISVDLDANGNVTITPAQVDNGSNDACGIASLVLDITSFTCTNVGANNVVLTVTDNNGLSSTCAATVTVNDVTPPVAICQSISVDLDNSGNVSITSNQIDNGSTDACGIVSRTLDISTFTCANVGPNTVTMTVTDVNGNSSTCTSTVTVNDVTAPIAICQDITVNLDASGNIAIDSSNVDNGSNDACGIAFISVSPSSFTCANVGLNTVTMTVTDVNGNSSTCLSIVTVVDDVDPIAICQNITVQLDALGNATITPAQVDNGSNDACGILSFALDITTFTCANVGPNSVVLTVTDVNMNSATCSSIVTIEDNVAPVAICKDTIVYLDANGNFVIDSSYINNGSNDACGIATITVSPATFDCADAVDVTNAVVLTVTDVNGNSSTCGATVTVKDTLAPIIVCPANTTMSTLATSCFASYTIQLPAIIDNCTPNSGIVVTVTDTLLSNGDPVAMTITPSPGPYTIVAPNGLPVGLNKITITATDQFGNKTICVYTVQVNDVFSPIITNCPSNIVVSATPGACQMQVFWQPPTITDFCPGFSVVTSHFPGAQFPVGQTTTVTYTATDGSGNTSVCSFTVTVNGTCTPPTPDIRVRWQTPFDGIFNPGQTKDAVIRLNEVNGVATAGTIQVFIPAVSGYALTFDPNQTAATNPNVPVGNSTDGWTSFTYPNGALLLTTNNSIPSNGEFKVAIKLTATSSMTNSILRANLIPGSGGENNAANNSANINVTTL
jgi:subtilisin-like proprotein convertase family protein